MRRPHKIVPYGSGPRTVRGRRALWAHLEPLLAGVCRALDLGAVRAVRRIEQGSHHLVWKVRTSQGSFAVRPGASQGSRPRVDHARRESLWKLVGRTGVAPRYRGSAPVRTQEFTGWLEAFDWIECRHLNPRLDAEAVAHTLSRLHSLPVRRIAPLLKQSPLLSLLQSELHSYQRRNRPGDPVRRLLREATAAALAELRNTVSPRGAVCVVHNDLVDRNVLIQDGRAWLIDWDWAFVSSPVLDLFGFLSPVVRSWRSTPRFVSAGAAKRFLRAYAAHAGTRKLAELLRVDAGHWQAYNTLMANWLHHEAQMSPQSFGSKFYRDCLRETAKLEPVFDSFK